MRWFRRTSIATSLIVQTGILLVVAAVCAFILLAADARSGAQQNASQRGLDLSMTLAASPTVRAILAEAFVRFDADEDAAIGDASAALQDYVLELVEETEIDFVTIMHPSGTRFTHPNPDVIGETFLGTIAPALAGGIVTETYEGTLGPSVRAVVPVLVDDRVVGLVAAGVTVAKVQDVVVARLAVVGSVLVVALVLAALAAGLVARNIRAVTGGYDPGALARLFAMHEAALHSIEDGLVLVSDGQLQLINDRAREALGIDHPVPAPLDDVSDEARELLTGNADSAIANGRSLVVDRVDATVLGAPATMVTIRDRTALRRMAGELEAVRTMTRALRSQTHEFGNRLHTIATLIELGEAERALELAATEYGASQRLTDRVIASVDEPVIAALLVGKAAEAHERAVDLHVETHLEPGTQGFDAVDIVTVLGNLVDNGIDAAASDDGARGWVEVYLALDDDDTVVIQITDSGSGIDEDQRELVFRVGWSTKAQEERRGFGLAIVRDTVERLGGTIEIGEALADGDEGGGAVLTVRLPRPGGTL